VPDTGIVSVLPSATEIVCALGLPKHLEGVSHECDYPARLADLPIVNNTAIPKGLDSKAIDEKVRELLQTDAALYHLNVDALLVLKQTYIVTQGLCDVCAVSASEVEDVAFNLLGNGQVVNLEPMSLQKVLDTFTLLVSITQPRSEAVSAVQALQARVDIISQRSAAIADKGKPRVAMLEWIDPLFSAGHWTPELVAMAGGMDCLANPRCVFSTTRCMRPSLICYSSPHVVLTYHALNNTCPVGLICPVFETGESTIQKAMPISVGAGPRLVSSRGGPRGSGSCAASRCTSDFCLR
jgi:hypothetical protein